MVSALVTRDHCTRSRAKGKEMNVTTTRVQISRYFAERPTILAIRQTSLLPSITQPSMNPTNTTGHRASATAKRNADGTQTFLLGPMGARDAFTLHV